MQYRNEFIYANIYSLSDIHCKKNLVRMSSFGWWSFYEGAFAKLFYKMTTTA